MPTEFKVSVDGQSKDVLRIAELIAGCGVNLVTVSIERIGEDIFVRILTSDDESCTRCLMKADIEFDTREVLIAELNDRPGQWAKIARELTDAGLKIEASYLLSRDGDKMEFVFAVDEPKKGRQIIEDSDSQ